MLSLCLLACHRHVTHTHAHTHTYMQVKRERKNISYKQPPGLRWSQAVIHMLAVLLKVPMLIVSVQVGPRLMSVAMTWSCFLQLVLLTLELSLFLLSIGRDTSALTYSIYRGTTASNKLKSDSTAQSCYLLKSYNLWPSVGMDLASFVTAGFNL